MNRDPSEFASMFVGEPYPVRLRRERLRAIAGVVAGVLVITVVAVAIAGMALLVATSS